MKILDSRSIQGGIHPLQAFDPRRKPEDRTGELAIRIIGRADGINQVGHWIGERKTLGDYIGDYVWFNEPAVRAIPSWAPAWGSITTASALGAVLFSTGDGGEGGGMAGGGECALTSLPPKIRPLYDSNLLADFGYQEIQIKDPPNKPITQRYPIGTLGILLPTTCQAQNDSRGPYRQEEWFFHADNRLVAPNRGGASDMGTPVYDLKANGEYDEKIFARLQSTWRVIQPRGGIANYKNNVLAWQIGPTGCKEDGWGFVYGLAQGKRAVSVVNEFQGGPFSLGDAADRHTVARTVDGETITSLHFSTNALFTNHTALGDGPLAFEPVQYPQLKPSPHKTKVHLQFDTGAQRWRWWAESVIYIVQDDPERYDPRGRRAWPQPQPDRGPDQGPGPGLTPDPIPPAQPGSTTTAPDPAGRYFPTAPSTSPYPGVVVLDPSDSTTLPVPSDSGYYRPPDELPWVNPPNTETPGIDLPSLRPQPPGFYMQPEFNTSTSFSTPWVPGMGNRAFAASTMELAVPALIFRPQMLASGSGDLRNNPSPTAAEIAQHDRTAPMSMRLEGFGQRLGPTGANGSGAYSYTNTSISPNWSYKNRGTVTGYVGGTVHGGIAIMPPSTNMSYAGTSFLPPNTSLETTYFHALSNLGSGAYFSAGTLNLVNGTPLKGYSWGTDSSGNLIFQIHDNNTGVDASEQIRFSQAGNIEFKSSTSYYGTFDHAITAARTWTLPDASGTLGFGTLTGSGTATQLAYWSAATVLTGNAAFNIDAADGAILIGTATNRMSGQNQGLGLSGTQPGLWLYNSTGALNEKLWNFQNYGSSFWMQTADDAGVVGNGVFIINRTGIKTLSVSFGNSLAGSTFEIGHHVKPEADATYDLGSATRRWVDLYLSGAVKSGAWNGTAISYLYGGTGMTAVALGDILYGASASAWARLTGNITTSKKWLNQTGDGAASAAPAWTVITAADVTSGAALTRVDDTNVTLTLGGTPSTALLVAASITAGWTGSLAIGRGGTGQTTKTAAYNALSPATTKGDIEVYDGTNVIRIAVGTDAQVLTADSTQASGVKWAAAGGSEAAANAVLRYERFF